jgi:hypothetical protein
MIHTLTM